MSLVNGIARIPHDAALLGAMPVAPGVAMVGGNALVGRGADPKLVAASAVGGGLGLTALGTGVVDVVARTRGKLVERFVVDGAEHIARTTMELRYGIAGARIVAGLMGAGLGAFAAGAGLATRGGEPTPAEGEPAPGSYRVRRPNGEWGPWRQADVVR